MDPLKDFQDAILARNVVARTAAGSSAKAVAEAAKYAAQAERAEKRIAKILSGRKVLMEDADAPLAQLHDLYNKVKGLAEKHVDKVEKFLKDAPEDRQSRVIAHDLSILKDNMSRRKDLATGAVPKARDLYTSDDLGSGPLRKSQYHKLSDLARNLEGGCSSYASAMADLEEYMTVGVT